MSAEATAGRRLLAILGAGLLLVTFGAPAAAQTRDWSPRRNGFALGGGYLRYAETDELVSPLRYAGGGAAVELVYRWSGDRGRHDARLGRSHARLVSPRSAAGVHEAGFTRWTGSYAYLRPFHRARAGRLVLLAGGQARVQSGRRLQRYSANREQTFDHLFASVHAAAGWELRLGGVGRLAHSLSVPVASAALRPPWWGSNDVETRVTGPTGLTGIEHRLQYVRDVSPRLALALDHHLTLLRYDAPRATRTVAHGAGVRLELRTGGVLP